MNIKDENFTIGSVQIEVVRKNIKNMHLAVYPPHGRVRLAAPEQTDIEVLRLFAISKLSWLKKKIKSFENQARETAREYVSGESHYYQGRRYLLEVKHHKGYNKIELQNRKIVFYTKESATTETRSKVFKEWYRRELKKQIPTLIDKWQKVIGVEADEWGVKQMLTKWGACNIEAKRIWLNLELAKKPTICLEYIIVHELIHLIERNHNDNFIALMDKFMPKWRLHRDELNSLPIVHNDWGY
ncbi:MAG: M48 family metallopeptidase [Carboxylicivirga sp.]|jgi:predicted metal-dependent hydrolase|nr:M48 family metallopeptidase [Carboxylicivirga sp.]